MQIDGASAPFYFVFFFCFFVFFASFFYFTHNELRKLFPALGVE